MKQRAAALQLKTILYSCFDGVLAALSRGDRFTATEAACAHLHIASSLSSTTSADSAERKFFKYKDPSFIESDILDSFHLDLRPLVHDPKSRPEQTQKHSQRLSLRLEIGHGVFFRLPSLRPTLRAALQYLALIHFLLSLVTAHAPHDVNMRATAIESRGHFPSNSVVFDFNRSILLDEENLGPAFGLQIDLIAKGVFTSTENLFVPESMAGSLLLLILRLLSDMEKRKYWGNSELKSASFTCNCIYFPLLKNAVVPKDMVSRSNGVNNCLFK
jgi:hypothetical protein